MRDSRDELDIRNIVAHIAHYSDMGELDDYGSQFAEDAYWEMPPAPPKRGRREIQEAGAARRAEGLTGPGSQTRHIVTTVAVTVDGDAAVADSYWQFYSDTATAPVLRLMGHYRDTFRRDPDGWRLVERLVANG
jgi:3-phenylpropionate/cinnamic acid dioxygenase small subunit